MNKGKIIDVEYNANEETIDNEPCYNCKEVSSRLNISEETIRTWVKFFNPLIHVPTKHLVKKYTKQNIKQLAFIKSLLEENKLDLQEAKEHISKYGFQMNHSIMIKDMTTDDKSLMLFEAIVERVFDKKIAGLQNSITESKETTIAEIQNQKQAIVGEIIKAKNENNQSLQNVNNTIKGSNQELKTKMNENNKAIQSGVRKIVNDNLKMMDKNLVLHQKEIVDTQNKNIDELKTQIQGSIDDINQNVKDIKFHTVTLQQYQSMVQKKKSPFEKFINFVTKEI